jgi:hypothetical protein
VGPARPPARRCDRETGDSTATLARYGLRRERDQPALAKLAPAEAVDAVRGETGMNAASASELLGLIALEGMAVARCLLARLTRDPAPPGENTERDLAGARHAAELRDLAAEIAAGIHDQPAAAPNEGAREREPLDQPTGHPAGYRRRSSAKPMRGRVKRRPLM